MTTKPPINIIQAVCDDNLFGKWFANPDDWQTWFAFLAALFALPMTDGQRAVYEKCTGRKEPPSTVATEAWLVCGRRAGKSFILALIAVFLACFHDYRRYLQPGERATVIVIAADRKQARVILRYIRGLLHGVPMLRRLIENETKEGFDLTNSITMEIGTASHKSVRGYAICAALIDEVAYLPTDDAAAPDYEILNAIRPAMAQFPNAKLLCASSPYARKGALYSAHKTYFGKPGPILVWQAATRVMNPSVPQSFIDNAYEKDPISAAAEYGANFRTDVSALLTREAVEAIISPGVRERPFISKLKFRAFVDPSGGSSDSMTLAIAHREGAGIVLDLVRERKPPFSPEDVVKEFAATLKEYRIAKVVGDRFGGEWVRESFRRHGISYELSAQPKSDLYRDAVPLVNAKTLDLLDHDRMTTQLIGLERRTSRGGRDLIDHSPGGHDDLANVVAGVASLLSKKHSGYDLLNLVGGDTEAERESLEDFLKRTGNRAARIKGGAIQMER